MVEVSEKHWASWKDGEGNVRECRDLMKVGGWVGGEFRPSGNCAKSTFLSCFLFLQANIRRIVWTLE